MKTFQILPAMLLLGLTTAAVAQNDVDAQRAAFACGKTETEAERDRNLMIHEKNRVKVELTAVWNEENPYLMAYRTLYIDDLRDGIGVPKEQYQKMINETNPIAIDWDTDPVIKPHFDEINRVLGGIYYGNLTEEEMRTKYAEEFEQLAELERQMEIKLIERPETLLIESQVNAAKANLTLDQMQKFKEYQIATMSENSFISPNMFEALNLSDFQKAQLDGIKKEMEPEFERYVDKMVDVQWRIIEQRVAEFRKIVRKVDEPEERQKFVNERWKEIDEEVKKNVQKFNPELFREMDNIRKSGTELSDKLKIEMFDVLSDEQWKRMLDLIDNPPEYVKKILADMRKEREKNAESKPEVRQPGPNSWRPGDPIPGGYRQQRQERGRFPRVNQSE